MAWIKALAAETLAPGTRQIVKLEEQSLLLLNESGNIYAINNICPHLKLPLKKGKVTAEGTIVCPWHRSAFDLCSGEVKNWTPWPPGVGKIMSMVSEEKALPVFPTRVEEGQIWVEIEA